MNFVAFIAKGLNSIQDKYCFHQLQIGIAYGNANSVISKYELMEWASYLVRTKRK